MINRSLLASLDTDQEGSLKLQLTVLRALIGPSQNLTAIDLCCGEMANTRHIPFRYGVHVDIENQPLRPKEFNFLQMDVLAEDGYVFNQEYDVAICTDGIEHFRRDDGLRLAARLTKLGKLAIIFTPLGDYMVDVNGKGPHTHKSGWLPEDLPDWESLAFTNWHPTLGCGGLFFWKERP